METIVLTLLILAILFVLSLKLRVLDLKGSVAALFIGAIVSFIGSIYWLILMLIFVASSFLATKAFFSKKVKMKVQEGEHGERRISNVTYAALVGIMITLIYGIYPHMHNYFFELFAISFAVINSDTFASEIGVIDQRVYMITTFKRVRPGVNGGVSLTGELAAILGGFIIAMFYSIFAYHGFNVPRIAEVTAAGFVGCQIDSILGALFENRGKLNKGQVNFLSSFLTVMASAAMFI
ncbi:conserved hypothetical protein [Thermoplasma acidophilum]|uniref:DUF92 domain-containing protein n=1 Tax=Thermoplasma acidophilum (strain ATCC 25905 / DSM 1728 / JCM 9062 / NBRC 15155 / AMRC-C165) TaxID=273075 RepID=Q9HKS6_THEAC|nr:TIGR00297 family protein [Thermoplasma acidophilum]MCY0852383.1 TIGR00297 family protein [Thermoplasma acidophilum]CAC11660.1 conserved hypothetical protein [Thermoplasma acidophilum]